MFTNAFKFKYKTKSPKQIIKISKSMNWQIIDIRAKEEYVESHIINSINIPHHLFKILYYKKIDRNKKILLVSYSGRSHLNLYRLLKKHYFKVYILYGGWMSIKQNDQLDKIITYNPID